MKYLCLILILLAQIACGKNGGKLKLLEPRSNHKSLKINDCEIVITGGYNESGTMGSVEVLNICNMSTRKILDLTPRFNHTMVLLDNGDIMLAGGIGQGMKSIKSLEVFNPKTLDYFELEMNEARTSLEAHKLKDGSVLIMGGETTVQTKTTEIYQNGMLLLGPAMKYARAAFTVNSLPNNDLIVIGGMGEGQGYAEVFNQETKEFDQVIQMKHGRGLHKASNIEGGILVNGGFDGLTIFEPEFFNFETMEFESIDSNLPVRDAHTSTVMPSGEVVMVAGADFGKSLTTVVKYDPKTKMFLILKDVEVENAEHTTHVLSNDTLIIIGGGFGDHINGYTVSDRIEIYNINTSK